MGKLTLLFAFAFIALQGSYGASLGSSHNQIGHLRYESDVATSKVSSRGILDLIQELKKKIEAIVEAVTNLPSAIAEIPSKIQELLAKLNIAGISRQLQTEVDDIIKDGGRDAEDCRPEAEQRINDIIEAAEKAAKECREASNDKLEELKNQIVGLISEAKKLLIDFNLITVNCALENKLNPVGFIKCLETKYNEFKQKVADYQDKISAVAAQGDDILKDVAQCVNKVQIETVNQGQVLIEDVEKCVRTIH